MQPKFGRGGGGRVGGGGGWWWGGGGGGEVGGGGGGGVKWSFSGKCANVFKLISKCDILSISYGIDLKGMTQDLIVD